VSVLNRGAEFVVEMKNFPQRRKIDQKFPPRYRSKRNALFLNVF